MQLFSEYQCVYHYEDGKTLTMVYKTLSEARIDATQTLEMYPQLSYAEIERINRNTGKTLETAEIIRTTKGD